MAAVSPQRIRSDITSLSHRGLGVGEFSLAAARSLRRRVPYDGVCVLTIDPATLLPTAEVIENGLPSEATERLTEIELSEPDFNKFAELARSRRPAASLSEATAGALDRSTRHRELKRPNGFDDELRAAFVDGSETWGAITLLREAGRARFAAAEVSLLASLSPYLADGLRRAILLTVLSGDGDDHPDLGLLVLGDENSIESTNAAALKWLDELGSADRLPLVIHAVAGRARSAAAGDRDDGSVARARVQTHSGRWLVVRGSILGEDSDARVAVILEPARSPELAPLIADLHGFSERERAVTQLVARGLPTREIASELHLSPHTVQDHLKSIFEKAGVASRGELVARLFFEQRAPRLMSGAPPQP